MWHILYISLRALGVSGELYVTLGAKKQKNT